MSEGPFLLAFVLHNFCCVPHIWRHLPPHDDSRPVEHAGVGLAIHHRAWFRSSGHHAHPCHKGGGLCAVGPLQRPLPLSDLFLAAANIKLAHTPHLRSRHRGGYTRLAGWLESPSARGGSKFPLTLSPLRITGSQVSRITVRRPTAQFTTNTMITSAHHMRAPLLHGALGAGTGIAWHERRARPSCGCRCRPARSFSGQERPRITLRPLHAGRCTVRRGAQLLVSTPRGPPFT